MLVLNLLSFHQLLSQINPLKIQILQIVILMDLELAVKMMVLGTMFITVPVPVVAAVLPLVMWTMCPWVIRLFTV